MIEKIEILRELDDKKLHGRVVDELKALQNRNEPVTSFPRRDFFLIDKNSRKSAHITTDGSYSYDLLTKKLKGLGFYLDRPVGREDKEIFFYCPRSTGEPAPTMGGGVFSNEHHVFPSEMLKDQYQRLVLSEFIGLQHAETADLHHQIVDALETNAKIYPGAGLLELEEIIAEKLTYLLPNAGIDETEVIRKQGSSLYRITIRHGRGKFDAFFKVADAESKAEAA